MIGCELVVATALSMAQAPDSLPEPDHNGRRKTRNAHGYADTIMSQTQKDFIYQVIQDTKDKTRDKYGRLPIALHIGAGFGDLELHVLFGRGSIASIDMEHEHTDAIKQRFSYASLIGATLEVLTGRLPFRSDASSFFSQEFQRLLEKYYIVHIGSFLTLTYLNPEETRAIFEFAFKLLPPGGFFYITGASPYNNIFPGWGDEVYNKRLELFELDPLGYMRDRHGPRLPGYIRSVAAKEMDRYRPPNYHENLPDSIHLLDPRVLGFLARHIGFHVVPYSDRFYRREHTPQYHYRGSDESVADMATIILQKP